MYWSRPTLLEFFDSPHASGDLLKCVRKTWSLVLNASTCFMLLTFTTNPFLLSLFSLVFLSHFAFVSVHSLSSCLFVSQICFCCFFMTFTWLFFYKVICFGKFVLFMQLVFCLDESLGLYTSVNQTRFFPSVSSHRHVVESGSNVEIA